jgi:hypothetical protein
MKIPLILLAITTPLFADPLLTSWSTARSGQYCRIYLTLADAAEGNGLTTWTGQTLPAYTDIQKVESSND